MRSRRRRFRSTSLIFTITASLLIGLPAVLGDERETETGMAVTRIGQTEFRVADGWEIRRVADEPLVRYPVHADLAPDGRLFVVESSGSGAPVKEQLEQRPHRLVVLSDTDGDGVYDDRTVFAEGLMLPQGVLWTEDGVLVATPPEIWRFRDTTGDGVADDRSVWFDGKTLTGCANDLHGPFLGRDGFVHWCKGAFAEQTYPREDGSEWSTRASHVFRKHPRTGIIESVMTGGMDNPVEFAMSLCGERFFTCTFIQHPAEGRRDALVHAVYGGVYGKDHGVLDGHRRTGPLMPVMTHLGPAAPAGLMMRESSLSDDDLMGELLVAHFNLQRVTRHRLVEDGASVRTIDSDLLIADRPDFHPTDVLEDRDGSLLVVDTGGWYTLCCPTSHIDQSQATGGVYRLTQTNRPKITGPEIAWDRIDAAGLIGLLGDGRPAVRGAARRRLVAHPDAASALSRHFADSAEPRPQSPLGRVNAVWVAIELVARLDPAGDAAERSRLLDLLVVALGDREATVRMVAMQGLGLHRHSAATAALIDRLSDGSPRERRFAAEALGRIGDAAAVGPLVDAFAWIDPESSETDVSAEAIRTLGHSIVYALIEIGEAALPELRPMLAGQSPRRRMVALRVMDQLNDPELVATTVLAMMRDGDDAERELASEVLGRRPAWDAIVAVELPGWLRREGGEASDATMRVTLRRLIQRPGLAGVIGEIITEGPERSRRQILDALAESPPATLPAEWIGGIAGRLADTSTDADELKRWCQLLAGVNWKEPPPESLVVAFSETSRRVEFDVELWLAFAAASPPGVTWRGGDEGAEVSAGFGRLVQSLASDSPPAWRQLALASLSRHPLQSAEARRLAETTATLGPMELAGVLRLLRSLHDEATNAVLIEAIGTSVQLDSLPPSLLEDHFREHPETIRRLAQPLVERLAGDGLRDRREHLRRLSDELPAGDALRGFQVFRGSKAACSACHAVGYFGGRVGPDLTQINRIRTTEDLIEAIVYPSASFVRSYESILVMTDDGRAISGLIADEDAGSITLTTGIDQRVRIDRENIEAIQPSPVSIMPAGLDQQLTRQELADLLAFLKSER